MILTAKSMRKINMQLLNVAFATVLFFAFSCFSAEYFSDYNDICETQTAIKVCEKQILAAKSQEKPLTMRWYKVAGYYLDFLYDQNKFTTLDQQTEQLIQLENNPDSFLIQLYYYRAKALSAVGRRTEGKAYGLKAIEMLKKTVDAFPKPIREVEIANLEYVYGDAHSAYTLLQNIHNKYKRIQDPILHLEIQSNMAHIQDKLGNLIKSQQHRQHAFFWAKESGNTHYLAIAAGNLAYTYNLNQQYDQAFTAYQYAVTLLEKNGSFELMSRYYLRLIELTQKLNKPQYTKQYCSAVKQSLLPPIAHKTYHEVKNKYCKAK